MLRRSFASVGELELMPQTLVLVACAGFAPSLEQSEYVVSATNLASLSPVRSWCPCTWTSMTHPTKLRAYWHCEGSMTPSSRILRRSSESNQTETNACNCSLCGTSSRHRRNTRGNHIPGRVGRLRLSLKDSTPCSSQCRAPVTFPLSVVHTVAAQWAPTGQ